MEVECWKPVEGYEGLYEVSDMGNVRSLIYLHTGKTRILKPSMCRGYLRVTLCKDRKLKTFSIHRLVATAFVPNMFGDDYVNHINEVKTDNRAANLMWCDAKENCNWGTCIERRVKAQTNRNKSKIVLQYTKLGEFIREWPSVHEVERVLGYRQGNISSCCRGEYRQSYGFIWKYKEHNGI